MPPAKSRPAHDDSRSDGSTTKEKAVAAAAQARKAKNGAAALQNGGSSLKELALVSTEAGQVVAPGQNAGMAWQSAPLELLNTYRVAHNLAQPPAFTSPYHQAILTRPGGIGRQSPTMARRKDKRRVSKEQLALAVRKNFNSAAVNEIDVVVELVYKVRHKGVCFPGLVSTSFFSRAVGYLARE
ncbi:hypothetical protein D0866_14564 [Hortaea werneckii]|nr:hypothetical protein D0866_14564 [Hortaea werneckii]